MGPSFFHTQNIKILIASIITLFVCLGLARFLYGMILPSMQNALYLSSSGVGLIGSANFVGYMTALFFADKISSKIGNKKMVAYSVLAISIFVFFISLSNSAIFISIFYFFTGLASALGNVGITVIVAHSFGIKTRGKAVGIMVMGNGMAMMLGGFAIPFINSTLELSWKYNWLFISIVSFLAFLAIFFIFKRVSYDVTNTNSHERVKLENSLVFGIGSIYFVFGFSYSVYVTFFISSIVKSGINEYQAGLVWVILGGFSLLSGIIFGAISDIIGRAKTIAIVYVLQATAYILPLFEFKYLSAALFGLTAWSVPSIISAMCADVTEKSQTANLFSKVTIFFGIGQIFGPIIAGVIIDYSKSFDYIFIFICITTIFGVLIAKKYDKKP